jgi:hypothetical protein
VPQRPRGFRQGAPPLAVFVLSTAFNAMVAYNAGMDPRDPGTWARQDSGSYIDIATTGYEYFYCAELKDSHYPPSAWCGSAGWMPGYPALIRALWMLGVPPPWAALAIAAGFCLALLSAVWFWFLDAEWTPSSLACLFLAGFFPGQIYYHAVFPISVFLFLAAMSLHLAERGRWWQAGLAGAAAAFTYTTGFLLAPVLLLGALLTWRERSRQQNFRLGLAAGMVCIGPLALFALHQYLLGVWNALFKVQAKYGHGWHDPLDTLFFGIVSWAELHPPALQRLLVLVILTAALFAARSAGRLGHLQVSVLVYLVLYWAFPLAIGPGVSLYRAESLLLPAVVLLRRLPWPALVLLTVAAAAVAYPMTRLFFTWQLL